jgi:hypothetical protein
MSAQEKKLSAEAAVCAAALPVFISHIETAHAQTNAAVRELNTSFAGMMRQLQEISAMAMAIHEGGAAAFERIDHEFVEMADAQSSLTTEYQDLARKTSDLTPLVSALLAAVRPGENSELTSAVETIATELYQVIEIHQRLGEQARAAGTRAETRVDAVLAPYGETLSKLAQCGDGMRGAMAECLMMLQFQDRVAQILTHTTSSMGLLAQYLQRGHALPEEKLRDKFFSEMESGYTTDEQRANHANNV